ncbi:hypothetical protein [Streptomyces wedmorensis]|uniref:hypothetical protein n=1 Tax=Streptomyces wedmorensis TaxID=43759 RepID=UPI003794305B
MKHLLHKTSGSPVSDPFVVHWPEAIRARGEVRDQLAHIIDMARTFDDGTAPTRHRTQHYEMFGHGAIDHDGWRAVHPWPGPDFDFAEAGRPFGAPIAMAGLDDLDAHRWELYPVDQDVAETRNLAQAHHSNLIETVALWYMETGKYSVMPIDGSGVLRYLCRPAGQEHLSGG